MISVTYIHLLPNINIYSTYNTTSENDGLLGLNRLTILASVIG